MWVWDLKHCNLLLLPMEMQLEIGVGERYKLTQLEQVTPHRYAIVIDANTTASNNTAVGMNML